MNILWGLLSKWRNELYGISILWIMLFHLVAEGKIDFKINSALHNIISHGNYGVDIFLFLSGISLYFSLQKNSNTIYFYKKRMARLLSPVLIISGTFFVWSDIYIQGKWIQFIKNITFYSFWVEGFRGIWFIALIVPLYLIYPFFFRFNDLKAKSILRFIEVGGFIFFLIVLQQLFPSVYYRIEIALTRIPIFLCGALVAYKVYLNVRMTKVEKAILFLALMISVYGIFTPGFFLNSNQNFRFGYFLAGISLPWIFILILEFFELDNLNKFFSNIGRISLELYVIHVSIYAIVFGSAVWKGIEYKSYASILLFFICILLGYIYDKIHQNIKKYFKGYIIFK
ncbi:acyltransferase family protein [Veillonella intestinalis]|uniref:acyltransferase family protein n=1 Tax=Veillonella intestinalis TaxID=2941341 RepID=UPI00204185E5|nr:acyltransferase family protein [Veillonella intestinalis]